MANQQGQNLAKRTEEFRDMFTSRRVEILAQLPEDVDPDRFESTVLTALRGNPELAKCTASSLWDACLQAARDGLYPDKRDGVILPYGQTATWTPMVWGIAGRVRQDGGVKDLRGRVRYEHDHFRYDQGDTEKLEHRPYLDGDRGTVLGAYAIAEFSDGHLEREYMSLEYLEKARAQSKAPNSTAWKNWRDTMYVKVVIKRLCKQIPLPERVREMLARDDGDNYADAPVVELASRPAPPRPTRASVQAPRPKAFQADGVIEDSKPEPGPKPKEKASKRPHQQQNAEQPEQADTDEAATESATGELWTLVDPVTREVMGEWPSAAGFIAGFLLAWDKLFPADHEQFLTANLEMVQAAVPVADNRTAAAELEGIMLAAG